MPREQADGIAEGETMADLVGQQLGNYTITRLLGRGGFADVYLGEHQYLKSEAAIKILQTRLSSDASLDGFIKEAQTIAHLSHPNIIRVLDFGVAEETPYLVMEYASNGTLRQRHPKATALPIATVVSYVKQMADALQFAHDERLIHRDVKPENMLLGRRNELLLSDFGIALTAQSSRSQRTQEAIGTVAYMSPEQIQGKPRPASDQYSLAIVAYEWLSGEPPFRGTFTELCTQHMFAPPPPLREKVETISPVVESILLKALDKEPHQRFESIKLFSDALEQASQGGSTVHMLQTGTSALASNPSYATERIPDEEENATYISPRNLNSSPPQSFTTVGMNESGLPPASARPAVPGPSPLFKSPNVQRTPTLPPANMQTTTTSTPPTESITKAETAGPQMTFHSDQTAMQTTRPASARPLVPSQQPQPGAQVRLPGQQQAPFAQPNVGQVQPQPQQYAQQSGIGQPFPGQQQFGGYGQPQQYPQQAAQPFTPQQQQFGQPNNPVQQQAYGQAQQMQPPPQYQPQRPTPPLDEPVSSPRARQEEESPRREAKRDEEDIFSGIMGEWKWPILASIGGLILFCLIHSFYPEIWKYQVPVVLAVPLFFGGAFGPWVGLLVGGGGALLSTLFYPSHDALFETMFSTVNTPRLWWVPVVLYTLVGVAAGLSNFRKRRFPTISSAISACLLSVFVLAGSLAYILVRANEGGRFPQIGLIALLGVAVGGVILIVYSVFVRLIDAGA
jgi:serine/threonine protein kinase